MSASPLDPLGSIKVKLGVVVVGAVLAGGLSLVAAGVLDLPIVVATLLAAGLALAVIQVLATGMTAPLREMARAAAAMAKGDYAQRVRITSADEVGALAVAFNRMAAELAESDRLRRDLVANVSHELRTPITALRAVLENLVDGVTQPDPEVLSGMLRQVERLSRLAGQLLELSRLEAGAVTFAREPVALGPLVARAVTDLRRPGEGEQPKVTVDVEQAGLRVRGDHERLLEVVGNLLQNALRHAAGLVEVRARSGPGGVVLEVADDGPGIPPEQRARVFERFHRVDHARSQSGGGAGLGLAIVAWIVRGHGGTVSAEARQPRGTRMVVTLPASQEPPMSTPTGPTAVPPPAVAPVPLPRPDLGIARPADWRAVVAALAVGLLADFALRQGDFGLSATLVLVVAAVGLVLAARPANRLALVLTGAAGVFALGLTLRASPWLTVPDAMVAVVLLVLAASLAHEGRLRDLTPMRLLTRGMVAAWHGVMAPLYLWTAAPKDGGRNLRPVLLGAGLAVPVIGVLGALLVSADAVFSSFFRDFLSLEPLLTHVFLIVVGAWAMAALLRTAAANPVPPPPVDTRVLDPLSVVVVLVAVDLLFAMFGVAQLVALSEGGLRVLQTSGLTYAEYARSGFFQLLTVSVLTVGVLLTLRATTRDRGPALRRWQTVTELTAIALTLVLVVVALGRLGLYIEVYGLTMLRLYSFLCSLFVGAVLLLLAGVILRPALRPWFGPTAVGLGLAVLLGLNIVNPEAQVVRWNVAQAASDRGPDRTPAERLAMWQLSDDATPALVAALEDLEPVGLVSLEGQLGCGTREGPLDFNLARWRAERLLETVCD